MTKRSVLWLSVLMSGRVLAAEERRDLETIRIVWLDPRGLFSDFDRTRDEADALFRDLGVSVCWEVGTDPKPSVEGEVRIQVVLMPSEPSGWGIAQTRWVSCSSPIGAVRTRYFSSTVRSSGASGSQEKRGGC